MSVNITEKQTAHERQHMHDFYRHGGGAKQMAPHVVYADSECPHEGCDQHMQGFDFRLEEHGRAVHDPLVKAWWDDIGFAGRCPKCNGWIHFTIQGKRAIDAEEAAKLPQLPDNWFDKAIVL